MNLRWLWLDHFPPGMELTEAQRVEAKKRARDHRQKEHNYRGSLRATWRVVGWSMTLLTVVFIVWLFLLIEFGNKAWYGAVLISGILLFQGLVWLGIALSIHNTYRPYILKALCDMGLPVCVECGYILSGIAADAPCPECGAERQAPQTSREPQI